MWLSKRVSWASYFSVIVVDSSFSIQQKRFYFLRILLKEQEVSGIIASKNVQSTSKYIGYICLCTYTHIHEAEVIHPEINPAKNRETVNEHQAKQQ